MKSKWINACDQWGWPTMPDSPEAPTLKSSNDHYDSKGVVWGLDKATSQLSLYP